MYLSNTIHRKLTNQALDKCKPLASSIPNLWCVSSVDSVKKATQLNAGRALLEPKPASLLNVHVQVNTSGEESKSGCQPGLETLEVCRHIKENCEHLKLLGLMTIGSIARSKATTPETENEDFLTLRSERDAVSKELGIKLELGMGMSDDFEGAILQGSDEVRVGSTIFGERPAKADFKVQGEVGGKKP
jgi:PLP dependent protein